MTSSPLSVGLAFGGGRYLSKRLLQLRSHSNNIQKIGGMMIVSTAMLLRLDIKIQLRLAPLFPALSI